MNISFRPLHLLFKPVCTPSGIAAIVMGDTVAARLAAASRLLAETNGTASFAAISAVQRDALLELINATTLTAVERADLSTEIVKIDWHGEDKAVLLASLDRQSTPAQHRKPLQDYTAIVHYFQQEKWDFLKAEHNNSDMKLATIIQQCILLGLRCPSELTLKFICTLWIFVSERNPFSLDPSQKHHLLKFTKTTFDRTRRSTAWQPLVHIMMLPLSPQAMQIGRPSLWQRCFGDREINLTPPFDVNLVHQLNDSYSCRSAVGTGFSRAPSAVSSASLGGDASTPLSQVFHQMQQMISAQQAMMMEMTGFGNRASGRGLGALQIQYAPRRMPTMLAIDNGHEQPAAPEPEVFHRGGQSSSFDDLRMALAVPAASRTLRSPSSGSLAITPSPVRFVEPPKSAHPEPPNAGSEFLDMLEERRRAKVRPPMKRPASAVEVVGTNSEDEVEVTAAGKKEPTTVDAKADVKPKAKAKAKPIKAEGVGKPKKADVKPKGKAKAKPISSDEDTPVKPKGGGKPKVAAKIKKDTSAAAEVDPKLTGCAKCRGGGCARCRAPGFRGKRVAKS